MDCSAGILNERLTVPKASAWLWLLPLRAARQLGAPGTADRGCSSFHQGVPPSSAAFPPRPPAADWWVADGRFAPLHPKW